MLQPGVIPTGAEGKETDPGDSRARAADGDPAVWEALLRQHWPAMAAYAALRTSNPATVTAVVDRAFDRLHDRIDRPRPAMTIRLMTAVRTELDTQGSPAPRLAEPPAITTADGTAMPPDPSDAAAAWRQAFGRLGGGSRDLVALMALAGIDPVNLAEVVGGRRAEVAARARAARDDRVRAGRIAGGGASADGDQKEEPSFDRAASSLLDPTAAVDEPYPVNQPYPLNRLKALMLAPVPGGWSAEFEADPPARLVVAVRQRAIERQVGGRVEPRPARSRARHYSVIAAAVGGIIVTALFVGLVLGSTLPRPVRAFARVLGLPVESVSLSQAEAEMATLAAALRRGDADAARTADQRLSALVAGLDSSERDRVVALAEQLHSDVISMTGGDRDDLAETVTPGLRGTGAD
ncbi:MAG: RNA polymerase sigma factor [Acidimicrobiales bacterium]